MAVYPAKLRLGEGAHGIGDLGKKGIEQALVSKVGVHPFGEFYAGDKTGAKSGQTRVNPLLYQQVGDDFAVFASKAGADTHPDWYRNLVANPEAVAEVGGALIPVTARVAEGDERTQIFERQKAAFQWFAEYEQKTTRVIPVVILERRSV